MSEVKGRIDDKEKWPHISVGPFKFWCEALSMLFNRALSCHPAIAFHGKQSHFLIRTGD